MKKFKKREIIDTMILCAGRGKRMRYKTQYIAKPLIKIQNKPILTTNLQYLAKLGKRNCIINNSYKYKTIQNFIKDYSYKNPYPKIHSSYEIERLETGGGVKKALHLFNKRNILVINGDSLLLNRTNVCPVSKLYDNFNDNQMHILLLIAPIKNSIGYEGRGDFIMETDKIISKIKRNKKNSRSQNYVFTGWQIINKELFNQINKKKFSLNLLYDLALNQKKLFAVKLDGYFLHTSTPKSILQIEQFINSKKKILNEKNYIL